MSRIRLGNPQKALAGFFVCGGELETAISIDYNSMSLLHNLLRIILPGVKIFGTIHTNQTKIHDSVSS